MYRQIVQIPLKQSPFLTPVLPKQTVTTRWRCCGFPGFLLPTVTSLWTKQRLSAAVSREEIHRTVNCGFSFKYFGLTVWKECKGPHLFYSLSPTLSIDFSFFSRWSHWRWSHTISIKYFKERVLVKTLKLQHSFHNVSVASGVSVNLRVETYFLQVLFFFSVFIKKNSRLLHSDSSSNLPSYLWNLILPGILKEGIFHWCRH